MLLQSPMIRKIVLLSFFTAFFASAIFAQKTDTLVNTNGNIITGEIKKIEYGLLTFKVSGMGTLSVETEKIQTLKSVKQFQITLDNGLLYFGSLDTVISTENKVKIVSRTQTYIVYVKSIVELFPIKKNFWLRTSGNFSLGGNYTKSSKILQLNFTGSLNYRTKKRYVEAGWNNQVTIQNDSIISEKQSNTMSYRRYFKNHYSFQGQLGASSNQELNLKSRIYLNLTAGKDFIHTYRSVFYTGLGLSGNSEIADYSNSNSYNLEGVLMINYEFYKRTDPQINITTTFDTYPSFTINGRWRFDASLNARIEVFTDFYLGVNIYNNFDNNTNLAADKHNDWGINTTFSYSFH